MEDPQQQQNNNHASSNTSGTETSSSSSGGRERGSSGEAVRSRWTPKPEQILILESIFNSGMVNPPKEETVRIRKLLEKFGAVGDANVFYWFQNRRSRSRRRQRQLQAATAAASLSSPQPPPSSTIASHTTAAAAPLLYDYNITCTMAPPVVTNPCAPSSIDFLNGAIDHTVSGASAVDDVFTTLSNQMQMAGFPLEMGICSNPSTSSILCSSEASNINLDFSSSGIVTVFINGVATQLPEGPLDMKAMFGEEALLLHSSGVPVPFNDYGISLQSLQHGESYFLVPRIA